MSSVDTDLKTESQDPAFLLVSSDGPAADYQCSMFGLFTKTEEMADDRCVYTKEHFGGLLCKLFSSKGVWSIIINNKVQLKATTPSVSPTSVRWQ